MYMYTVHCILNVIIILMVVLQVHNSSGRLVSKISTALEPLETTPTISINKPHPFSVPDNSELQNITL